MALEGQPEFDGTMDGQIYCFLTANKFRVELDDGQVVDAAVPDDLIETIRPYYTGEPLVDRIRVVVEFRQPPAMHRIIRSRAGAVGVAPRGHLDGEGGSASTSHFSSPLRCVQWSCLWVRGMANETDQILLRLQRWYVSRCDGEWEHGMGVRIETLDNPGWQVVIDSGGHAA